MERAKFREVFINLKRDPERVVFHHRENCVLRGRQMGQQEHRLDQNRLAYEQRSIEFADLGNGPAVMFLSRIEERDERARVSDRPSSHARARSCA